MSQQISYQIGSNLYLSITDRCTLECTFCPKNRGSHQVHEYDLTMDHRPEIDEIIAAIGDPSRYEEVVFCGYGEPTLRLKVLLAVAQYVKENGGRVRVNTDGLANLVHKDDVLPLLAQWVDCLSISMNAQCEEVYERHCEPGLPGSFNAMLSFMQQASQIIPRVYATAVDGLEGVDVAACEKMAQARGALFRRRELDKVG
jgi:TatD family-associated radical SAM protein